MRSNYEVLSQLDDRRARAVKRARMTDEERAVEAAATAERRARLVAIAKRLPGGYRPDVPPQLATPQVWD